jgi:hypothetical protein
MTSLFMVEQGKEGLSLSCHPGRGLECRRKNDAIGFENRRENKNKPGGDQITPVRYWPLARRSGCSSALPYPPARPIQT